MTARLLRELDRLRSNGSTAFETIVVDNASPDETPQAIAAFPWVNYQRFDENRNFAGGCNAGSAMAHAPIVLFLNNDAYPLGDALEPLVRAFDREEVCVAGGALFFEDGATQGAGFVVLPNAHWHYSCRNLPPDLDDVTRSRDAIGVSGAAMAVRNDWFCARGGFDESYINGFEDVDLCMRAREEHRVIRYVAQARFAHYEGATSGRFDREAANERQFYSRWSSAFSSIPRIARGAVGAIALPVGGSRHPMLGPALEDLEAGLRSFGHPIVRGAIAPWQRLDRRFRHSASIDWFRTGGSMPADTRPGVLLERPRNERALIRSQGAVAVTVPWLPCADPQRIASLPIRRSDDPDCATIALAGLSDTPAGTRDDILHAIDQLAQADPRIRVIVLGSGAPDEIARRYSECASAASLLTDATAGVTEVACVIHAGLTDDAGFGTVLLGQAELPAVAVDCEELRATFAHDVALFARPVDTAAHVRRFLEDPEARIRYASVSAADARRRFSPRRSAIRIVDVLCAARFGLERAAPARTNTPL